MNLIGIDYGINSPALCKWKFTDIEEDFRLEQCDFYTTCIGLNYEPLHNFFWYDVMEEMKGMENSELGNICKYDYTSYFFTERVDGNTIAVGLEGYSMGAKGLVFNIAEATGILKYKIYNHTSSMNLQVFAPTEIKKFAGKGNWNKVQMYDALCKKLDIDFAAYLGLSDHIQTVSRGANKGKIKLEAPLADFADATWIVLYLREKILESKILSKNIL